MSSNGFRLDNGIGSPAAQLQIGSAKRKGVLDVYDGLKGRSIPQRSQGQLARRRG